MPDQASQEEPPLCLIKPNDVAKNQLSKLNGARFAPGAAMLLQSRVVASAARDLEAKCRADFGLLGGGAVAARNQRVLDIVLLERLTDRKCAFAASHRSTRRNEVGHEDDIILDHVAKQIAVGVRVLDVVDADFVACIVLEC